MLTSTACPHRAHAAPARLAAGRAGDTGASGNRRRRRARRRDARRQWRAPASRLPAVGRPPTPRAASAWRRRSDRSRSASRRQEVFHHEVDRAGPRRPATTSVELEIPTAAGVRRDGRRRRRRPGRRAGHPGGGPGAGAAHAGRARQRVPHAADAAGRGGHRGVRQPAGGSRRRRPIRTSRSWTASKSTIPYRLFGLTSAFNPEIDPALRAGDRRLQRQVRRPAVVAAGRREP